MSLIELNYESAKEIRVVAVRKIDWSIQLYSGYSESQDTCFALLDNDDRLLVGSHKGAFAIISLLGKILEQPFVGLEETDSYFLYARRDYYNELKNKY